MWLLCFIPTVVELLIEQFWEYRAVHVYYRDHVIYLAVSVVYRFNLVVFETCIEYNLKF